jgi:hypothetical protein
MCLNLLLLSEFYADRRVKTGLQRRCKRCQNAASYESRRRNAPPSDGYEARQTVRIAARFGITQDDYDWLMATQDGVCAICRQPETRHLAADRAPSRLAIDHQDDLGIRGLLCYRCNIGLGHFRDNPELLDAAAAYLRKSTQQPLLRGT